MGYHDRKNAKFHRALWGAAAVAAASSIFATAAAGSASAVVVSEGKSLYALGDSFSSGNGSGPYSNVECNRSLKAYPNVWAAAHPSVSVRSFACSGATSADVERQAQLMPASADMVTLTAGGNDVGFTSTLTACAFGSDAQCITAVDEGRRLVAGSLGARLSAAYSAVRKHAPAARVQVLGYPRLFTEGTACAPTEGGADWTATKRAALNQAADLLNETIQRQAIAAGFTFTDVRDAFAAGAGHGICSTDPWITDFGEGSIEGWSHPNAAGQAAYAGQLLGSSTFAHRHPGYFTLTNEVTGKQLGAAGAAGSRVVQSPATGSSSQQWSFQDDDNGKVRLVNRQSGLPLTHSGVWNASPFLSNGTSGSGSVSEWRLDEGPGGYLRILSAFGDIPVEARTGSSAVTFGFDDTAVQHWTLKPAS
ncbi:GDSL-type esterase/lipase family protein [Leifsonia sp. LS-T14]|uniref:GDSL-type esterase/lipase family protein n=1 Tax=unclassified Leifsonia TaxID=2663824 RepID=UPI0035A70DFE